MSRVSEYPWVVTPGPVLINSLWVEHRDDSSLIVAGDLRTKYAQVDSYTWPGDDTEAVEVDLGTTEHSLRYDYNSSRGWTTIRFTGLSGGDWRMLANVSRYHFEAALWRPTKEILAVRTAEEFPRIELDE